MIGYAMLQPQPGGGMPAQQTRVLDDAERIDWLQLIRSEHVGPRTFRLLLDRCGSASAALDALPDLARRGGAVHPIRIFPRDAALREYDSAQRMGVDYVALGEPAYPPRLAMIDDAPPLLAVRGNAGMLSTPAVAIVGSRNASAAGIKIAERIARDLGQVGFAITSGLARGIDAAAHRSSLATGTIAVLAGGPDRIYPPDNAELLEHIVRRNAAISEMPLGWEPRARDFPRRNRLISGLSLGVVVIEAARRSGSLITARFALEQGREVFAVPGSPLDPRAEGSNGLIKQGATMATEAADVVAVLQPILGQPMPSRDEATVDLAGAESPSKPAAPPGTDARDRVLVLLGPTPVTLDDLARLSGLELPTLHGLLLELELAGRLIRHRGAMVSIATPTEEA
jgi:DNA processing protein